MLPIWVYVVVAMLIALLAFAVGQVVPGMGIMVAAGGSTMWAAYSASRARRA